MQYDVPFLSLAMIGSATMIASGRMITCIAALAFLGGCGTIGIPRVGAASDQRAIDNRQRNHPRRLRLGSIDSANTFDESPLIVHAFGDIEDVAETESFFRRLGSSMSTSSTTSSSSDSDKSALSNDVTNNAKPPTSKNDTPGSPTSTSTPTLAPVVVPTAFIGTPTPTYKCNLDNEQRHDSLLRELSVINLQADLSNVSTVQGEAFQWILSVDPMELCPDDERLVQRYVAAVFYYSTYGNKWRGCFDNDSNCGNGESYYGGRVPWLSGTSECNWAGLQCNMLGEITSIKLCECFPSL